MGRGTYRFKVVVVDGPPIYAATRAEAERIATDHGGAPIVENLTGHIDDPRIVEAANQGHIGMRLPWDDDPEVPDV